MTMCYYPKEITSLDINKMENTNEKQNVERENTSVVATQIERELMKGGNE